MMLDTFRANAGMFVKFGQLMASMGVLFPEPYVDTMKSMFQEAPQSDWHTVKSTIEASLYPYKSEEVFAHINQAPSHSGSIA